MSFTYDLATDVGKVRFELSDTDQSAALFSDEEITHQVEQSGSVLEAAADLCDILATRYASRFDFATDGQSFKRSQQAQAWAARAEALRERAGGGNALQVQEMARRDGYQDRYDRVRAFSECPEDFETPC